MRHAVDKMGTMRCFTLIELLVAMAVLAILAALLLPVLGRAKHKASQVSCLSNLHQIGLGFALYLSEHDDRFPDRRDLKTALGYRPWTTWPQSDPRGGWAAVVLSNIVSSTASSLPPAWRGRAVHPKGRNCLYLDMHASFLRDVRIVQ